MAATSTHRYMPTVDRSSGILIVEDRSIVAGKIRRELERAGLVVAAVTASRPAAIRFAETLPLAGAVLDIDLRGEPVFPVAQALRERAVPFIFLTGYSLNAVPRAWQDIHLVEKPFERDTLLRAIHAALRHEPATSLDLRISTPTIREAWDRVCHTRDLVTEQRAWTEEFGMDVRRP